MHSLRIAFARLVPALLAFVSAAVLRATPSPMQAYVNAMQPGTNLGNTLDAIPDETSWGAPVTTQAIIQGIAAKGYKSIRLPVTWKDHMRPAPGYTIDPVWMDHVQEIVDWSLNSGLYVMLNLHHDSWEWLNAMPGDHDAVLARYRAVWTQIATRFKNHSNKLMFESINEPGFRNAGGQDLPDAEMAAMLDEVNTAFFNVVRGTGGSNATRPLVLPSVYTRADQPMIDSLKATMAHLNDPNLIATVHYYGYYPFSVNLGGSTKFDDQVRNWVNVSFDAVHDTFVASGIPVIIGEWGVLAGDHIEHGEFLKYHEYVMQYGRAKNLTMMLWDTGGVYNRTTEDWQQPDLAAIMQQTLTGRATTAGSDLYFIKSGIPVQDAVIHLNLNGNSLVSLQDGATTLVAGSDYTLNGEVLTLSAHVLAGYATGSFGEKTTLTINSNSGPAWKIHVRYAATPVVSSLTGVTGGPLSIPAAFNGDILATIESRYADGSNAGPVGWTAFPQWGIDFNPDYANNAIVLDKNFFSSAPAGTVNFKFYFWSGKVLNYQVEIKARTGGGGSDYLIYGDNLASDWNNWGSWAANDLASTAQVHSGSYAASVTPGAYGGFVLQNGGLAMDTSAYHTLVFWVNGGATGGQNIGIGPIRGSVWGPGSFGLPALVANTWERVEVPFSSLGVDGSPDITGFYFQNWTGGDAPTFYIDDISLSTAQSTAVMDITGTPAPAVTSLAVARGVVGSSFSYTIMAVNNPATYTATGLPPGIAIDAVSGVISGTPTSAGSYWVSLGATNPIGTGAADLLVTVDPAPITIAIGGGGSPFGAEIKFPYDGAPRAVEPTTNPSGIPVTITYDGSTTVPTLPGTYHVVVTSNDPNYIGTAETTLVITVTALVRHAPTLNGGVDGSLQLLTGEGFSVSSGSVSGDLLVPGTPRVQLNGHPMFGGVNDAAGATAPTNYGITLNSGAVVRFVVRRVDPIAMPVVAAPATPSGMRSVTLNNASQGVGDFATVRDLTLNGNAGMLTVPAGVYRSFTVNGNSTLVFGVAGATTPAVYELQSLTLNGNASIKIAGPVTLKLAQGTSLNGTLGTAAHPEWLDLQMASGGLTLNGNAALHGMVTVPNGSVTLNGTLHGRVSADRLTINGNGLLEDFVQ